jgi:cyanophycin synthetase
MRLVDSRRLTGPNLQTLGPAALAEVAWDAGEDAELALAAWRREVARLHEGLGWPAPAEVVARRFAGGAALCFAAPPDLLLVATEVNDCAVARATAVGRGEAPASSMEEALEPLRARAAEEAQPALRALWQAAEARGAVFLLGEGELTLGAGRRSRTYRLEALPGVDEVPWGELGHVPVAFVTGTNGKTTSARLLAHMARAAGRTPGLTSTEGMFVWGVAGTLVEEGDWTGPGGARAVLRRPEVDLAVLEAARGGILRRGLGVTRADAALITNVAADHLGEYGVEDVATMAAVKAVIGRVVPRGGRVVLNAADPELVALAGRFAAEVVYFAVEAEHPVVRAHLGRGGEAWVLRAGALVRAVGAEETRVVGVDEVPIAYGGAALYNVENALGAAAMGAGLGFPLEALRAGLRSFGADPEDNAGRGQLVVVGGVRVLVDFGHNPDGVRAVMGLCAALRRRPSVDVEGAGPGRFTVIVGLPGDRREQDFSEVAREIAAGRPDRVLVHDLPGYLRGRAEGEVPELLRRALLGCGMAADAVAWAAGETAALEQALDTARPGDFVLILAHIEGDGVRAALRAHAARG